MGGGARGPLASRAGGTDSRRLGRQGHRGVHLGRLLDDAVLAARRGQDTRAGRERRYRQELTPLRRRALCAAADLPRGGHTRLVPRAHALPLLRRHLLGVLLPVLRARQVRDRARQRRERRVARRPPHCRGPRRARDGRHHQPVLGGADSADHAAPLVRLAAVPLDDARDPDHLRRGGRPRLLRGTARFAARPLAHHDPVPALRALQAHGRELAGGPKGEAGRVGPGRVRLCRARPRLEQQPHTRHARPRRGDCRERAVEAGRLHAHVPARGCARAPAVRQGRQALRRHTGRDPPDGPVRRRRRAVARLPPQHCAHHPAVHHHLHCVRDRRKGAHGLLAGWRRRTQARRGSRRAATERLSPAVGERGGPHAHQDREQMMLCVCCRVWYPLYRVREP
mmetsp:Transcript_18120/g.59733  ORF Transcript_18120/g.59733 Transcript_18120/m.59733 type:complete len:396 (-) Transcript_18120:66-1253(-)